MPFYIFLWTDEIVAHLQEHEVTPEDFEYVVCNAYDESYSRSSGLPICWAYAPDGRHLMAVYRKLDDETIIPVTAYEVPEPR